VIALENYIYLFDRDIFSLNKSLSAVLFRVKNVELTYSSLIIETGGKWLPRAPPPVTVGTYFLTFDRCSYEICVYQERGAQKTRLKTSIL